VLLPHRISDDFDWYRLLYFWYFLFPRECAIMKKARRFGANLRKAKGCFMDKVFKAMDDAGKYNLVTGICWVVTSVASCICGAFLIVHAVKLLKAKNLL
jgi:hypothetical protein